MEKKHTWEDLKYISGKKFLFSSLVFVEFLFCFVLIFFCFKLVTASIFFSFFFLFRYSKWRVVWKAIGWYHLRGLFKHVSLFAGVWQTILLQSCGWHVQHWASSSTDVLPFTTLFCERMDQKGEVKILLQDGLVPPVSVMRLPSGRLWDVKLLRGLLSVEVVFRYRREHAQLSPLLAGYHGSKNFVLLDRRWEIPPGNQKGTPEIRVPRYPDQIPTEWISLGATRNNEMGEFVWGFGWFRKEILIQIP